MPTRKLIRLTIGSAWAPTSWMVSMRSERRKRALPRSSRPNASVTSPRKARTSRLPSTSASASLPTRVRNEPGVVLRCAPDRSGTAVASCSSRRTPSGRPLASASSPARRTKPSRRRRKVSSPLSQSLTPWASNTTRRRSPRASSCRSTSAAAGKGWVRRQLPDSCSRTVPIAGSADSSQRAGARSFTRSARDAQVACSGAA